ncbi:MAG: tRNA 5-methylaminomethyl-2-thiouridine biosynthesis bifunctional protein MnmC [Chlamydiia bacterium]|nr:tRNA 5-methylaminomethyl-2-thiouridine biosynthesis bifunctional protein MnmC [Chlamydiia bacterium]MCH9617925.1 tRNA 5-methylaminomethyl-2-thiouridine biosynthesis bifunctional protein MnmC [Chlamydiia bacterium]MCH9624141.1 tRNA 5-methylaminomethyl-2-thiouridine biosynthesis bifunctional protein MnmC [Chlamydiia bacterium]
MSCVVVGSGIAGLSAAYFLQKRGLKVTIYSSEKKLAASNIFIGILYRYPGRWGKKSKFADDAYLSSKQLIDLVEKESGRKVIVSKGVIKKFAPRLKKFADVKMEGGDAYIDDALSIDMREYREGLKDIIGRDNFVEKEIRSLSEIDGPKVIACGHGVKELVACSGLMYRKGQQYQGRKKLPHSEYGSVVGRGHISFLEDDRVCLGSTYETEFEHDGVDKDFAVREINKKIEPWYGPLSGARDKKFVSGVRVGQDTTYLPLVEKIDRDTFLFTGLGSRGLLYHAYYGKILANQVGW